MAKFSFLLTTLVILLLAKPAEAKEVKPETVFMDKELFTIEVPAPSDALLRLLLGKDYHAFVLEFIANVFSQVSLSADQLKTPSLSGLASRFFSATSGALSPKVIKDKTIYPDDSRPIQVSGRLCIYNPDGSLLTDVISKTNITSSDLNPENQRELDAASRFLAAVNARGKLDPNDEGSYNLRREAVTYTTSDPLPCSATLATSDTASKPNAAPGANQFGISPSELAIKIFRMGTDVFCKMFGCHSYRVVYKGSSGWAYAANASCTGPGCSAGEISRAGYDIPGSEKNSGGWMNTFRPSTVSFSQGVHGGAKDQEIKAGGSAVVGPNAIPFAGKLQQAAISTMCMILPQSLQEQALTNLLGEAASEIDLSTVCRLPTSSSYSCNGKPLPDLSGSDESCGLCNTDEIDDFIGEVNPSYLAQLPEGKLPQVAIDVLNKAASEYKIPAPVLLGAMIHEGSFTWEDWQWTEENVACWTVEGGKIGQKEFGDDASCLAHAHPATGARGPFGWIDRWFNPYKDAVKQIDSGRQEINQCNYLDGAAAAAKSMYETQGGDADMPPSCGSQPLYQGAGRAASCGQWNEQRAATAIFTYGGRQCTSAVARTVEAFRRFKCF